MSPNYFGCDACERPIPSTDPRIHCLDCTETAGEYDLCASCALAERFTRGHTSAHRTRVFRVSGGGAQAPGLSSAVIVYPTTQSNGGEPATTPASPWPISVSSSTSHTSTHYSPQPTQPATQVNAFIASQAVPARPASPNAFPPPPKRVSMPPPLPARRPALVSTPSLPVSAYTMPPRDEAFAPSSTPAPLPPQDAAYATPPPARETAVSGPSQAQSGTAATWGPFFAADMSPMPVFLQLMDSLFTFLDTGRTGYLVPEAYSRFLIDQGYVGQENVWNANLIASFGQIKEDVADAALKRAFDLFSIDYILRPRPRPANAPADPLTLQLQATLGNALARNLTPPSASGGMMPLLTRQGFADITALELLGDPSRGWGNLSRVLKTYDVGPAVRAWGALPRSVLPDEADARVLARVARVQAFAVEQAQRELEAHHIKSKLEAQGRANALDLLDDRRRY